jgi:hypothetical protein
VIANIVCSDDKKHYTAVSRLPQRRFSVPAQAALPLSKDLAHPLLDTAPFAHRASLAVSPDQSDVSMSLWVPPVKVSTTFVS